jgi:REP element-mobilizing transposase RayT
VIANLPVSEKLAYMSRLQFFDPKQEHTIAWNSLPHWAQAGTVCFITWRTADSLPAAVVERLAEQRRELLRALGLNPNGDWRCDLRKLALADRVRAQWALFATWDHELDRGAGACVLSRPELSAIVEASLLHFDVERYELTDFVVMPNHVHVLVAFHEEDMLMAQCRSWKRYTSGQIQKALGRTGAFWQIEQFDHLVRDEDEFTRYRQYIAENPPKAHLPPGSFRLYSKEL